MFILKKQGSHFEMKFDKIEVKKPIEKSQREM